MVKTKKKPMIDTEKLFFMSSEMFILLVSFAVMMGFAFSVTNAFTRRPLANFGGTGLAILFIGFPLVYVLAKNMHRR
jgi:hypothetical protein